jgi:hypothetical protein
MDETQQPGSTRSKLNTSMQSNFLGIVCEYKWPESIVNFSYGKSNLKQQVKSRPKMILRLGRVALRMISTGLILL